MPPFKCLCSRGGANAQAGRQPAKRRQREGREREREQRPQEESGGGGRCHADALTCSSPVRGRGAVPSGSVVLVRVAVGRVLLRRVEVGDVIVALRRRLVGRIELLSHLRRPIKALEPRMLLDVLDTAGPHS